MTFVFFLSLFLLVLFGLVKILEIKQQKISWLSKAFASQDSRLKSYTALLNLKILSLKKLLKSFLYAHLPAFLKTLSHDLNIFIVESFHQIKDNIRGKYKKFRSSKPTSSYLREISKAKAENNKEKDTNL